MLRSLQLLLPALLPSWRFFDYIAPSPRIQFALLNERGQPLGEWREFRPRPAQLPFTTLWSRLLWNPRWNESLFLMSCAERILEQPTAHSEQQILERLLEDYRRDLIPATTGAKQLQFRLLLIERQGTQLQQQIVFESQPTMLPTR
ncbi:MAG: hypothetical protein QM808_18155 [Steroidobacteraceae bacterium]